MNTWAISNYFCGAVVAIMIAMRLGEMPEETKGALVVFQLICLGLQIGCIVVGWILNRRSRYA